MLFCHQIALTTTSAACSTPAQGQPDSLQKLVPAQKPWFSLRINIHGVTDYTGRFFGLLHPEERRLVPAVGIFTSGESSGPREMFNQIWCSRRHRVRAAVLMRPLSFASSDWNLSSACQTVSSKGLPRGRCEVPRMVTNCRLGW